MAGENPAYLRFVRTLPCRLHLNDPCDGPIEAHHAGERGLGQRAGDDTAIPLCLKHHRCWHDASGPFKTWKKHQRRGWIDQQIRWVRRQFAKQSRTTVVHTIEAMRAEAKRSRQCSFCRSPEHDIRKCEKAKEKAARIEVIRLRAEKIRKERSDG